MSNKMYSIAGSMLVLSAFHVAQGMNEEQPNTLQILQHNKKLGRVLNQMQATQHAPSAWDFVGLKQSEELKFQELFNSLRSEAKAELQAIQQYQEVVDVIKNYLPNLKYYTSEDFNHLEAARDQKLRALYFELKAQELEKSELLDQAFEQLFPSEQADQNQVCEELLKSVVKMEALLDANGTIAPVAVGWKTWFQDWYYGPKNLVDELKNKLPLEVLQKSPEQQKRINNMLASYSPSKTRNPEWLQGLIDIFDPLSELDFKFVDMNVNTEIYNACKKWLAEEEAQWDATRKAYISGIARFVTTELKRMAVEQAPREAIIAKLNILKELAQKTGVILLSDEEKTADTQELPMYMIVGHLDALSEEWLKEENAK